MSRTIKPQERSAWQCSCYVRQTSASSAMKTDALPLIKTPGLHRASYGPGNRIRLSEEVPARLDRRARRKAHRRPPLGHSAPNIVAATAKVICIGLAGTGKISAGVAVTFGEYRE